MRVLTIHEKHTIEEIRKNINTIKGYNDVVDWKIIQSVKQNPGIDAELIAKVLCLSKQKVYSVIQAYNRKGKEYKKDTKWGGRRNETSFISRKEEDQLLKDLETKAKKGLIKTVKDIKKHIEQRLGRAVSDDYLWTLLKRHGWKKKAPRPEHPKTDIGRQEDFKKNFLKSWQPPH